VLDLDVTITLPCNKVLHLLQASALIDWEGSPVILSATADITRIRQAERALRESEERYRDLVQGACIIILKFNTDGLLTFVNDYALEFFGFAEDELIGKPLIGTIVPEIDSSGLHLRPMMDAVCQGAEKFYDNINEDGLVKSPKPSIRAS
jgi:PAS domain-containing protein